MAGSQLRLGSGGQPDLVDPNRPPGGEARALINRLTRAYEDGGGGAAGINRAARLVNPLAWTYDSVLNADRARREALERGDHVAAGQANVDLVLSGLAVIGLFRAAVPPTPGPGLAPAYASGTATAAARAADRTPLLGPAAAAAVQAAAPAAAAHAADQAAPIERPLIMAATGAPPPTVTGGARTETAGTGGIVSITRTYHQPTGSAQTVIEGRVLPTMSTRQGLEALLGGTIANMDRAHLWGRIFGDEAAAGVLYAPSGFNRGVQRTLEGRIAELQQSAQASGGQLWLRAVSSSHSRDWLDGRALAHLRYEFSVRLPNGQIGRSFRIDFSVDPPGSPITRNRPGYTIEAPFEGHGPYSPGR